MLSAVITVLLLGVMLLIIASLILSALLEHRRHKQSVAIRTQAPTHPLGAHVGMVLHMQDGAIVSVEKPESLQHLLCHPPGMHVAVHLSQPAFY